MTPNAIVTVGIPVTGPATADGVTLLHGTSLLQWLPQMDTLANGLVGVAGLVLVVAAVAAAIAFPYRWYVRERVPGGLPVLIGLSVVAVSMGTMDWIGEVITGSNDLFSPLAILANLGVFVVAGVGALAGVSVGDRLARRVGNGGRAGGVGSVGGTLVQTVGRVITVELPAAIDDVVGYDPVSPGTKAALAGKSFTFPRHITVAELRERLTTRIVTDYAVGHVDVDLAEEGTVEYLALGSRAAGIGPTLPPETAAVAVQADPAFAASAGDLVQVWATEPPERVLTAELRGVADDVVTLAVDSADVDVLDDKTRYRLVTLPVADRPDRTFASLLRAADETMGTVTVAAGSELDGVSIAATGVSVVAIVPADGQLVTLPPHDRVLSAGDELYAIATPDALRKLEVAAGTTDDDPVASPPVEDVDD